MKILATPRTQHLLLRMHAGDSLPDSLTSQLRERKVTGGWLRLTGVLKDVELRAFSTEIEGPGGTKRFAGPLEAVVLDGSIGVADGGVALDLRVVLARETDRGLETIAGELLKAKVVGLDGSLTILEDTVVPRKVDREAGVSLLQDASVVVTAGSPAPVHTLPAPAPSVPAVAPSAPHIPAPTASGVDPVAAANPARPPTQVARPRNDEDEGEEGPTPQAGDLAEHFAFGLCEILKSDGDRLHVRMKDGRIREIALEMLKVTPLPPEGGKQRFRLARKL